MAGDNERFSARSPRWIRVAAVICSPDNTLEEAEDFILDNIYKTFSKGRDELRKFEVFKEAIQAFAEGNIEKLGELLHNTKGNQVVQIMIKAQKMSESPKIAVQRILCENIERLFSDMSAQARTDPEIYRRTKASLDMVRKKIPAIAEKLADRLVNDPFGKWRRNSAPKSKLSDSLLK